jgi:signal transduction histidine kinase
VATAIERVRLHDAERAARADAERALRLRDEVLAVVAHDLRNPLGRISMAASLLAEESLGPDRRVEILGVLRRSAEGMSRLVGDLLDVASIEAGRLAIERRPMDVGALVVDVHEMFRPTAARRGVRLERAVADALPLVAADRGRLLQVLGNLLDNALRLTPGEGLVVVSAEHAPDAVRLSVSDTGPGIAPEEAPHLFDRFWQGRPGRRGGAGLGLAIARGIVEAHRGRIWVESTPGEGSTFHILLPAVGAGSRPPLD